MQEHKKVNFFKDILRIILIISLLLNLLCFPGKYFSAKFNFIGYQKEIKEGFEKDTDDYWKQTTFFETGEMKVKTKAQRSMFEIVKKSVYCLSAFVKAN